MAVHLSFVLILTGLTGIHSITTVSDVSVKSRASITIPCLYDPQYTNHVKYLCKGTLWLPCSIKVTDTQGVSGKFSISDDKIKSIFTVTIKDLTDSDYYWCAVMIEDGSDVKKQFHLSVTRGTPGIYVSHQEVTGFEEEKITITCHHHRDLGAAKWCRLGSSCVTTPSGSIGGSRVTILLHQSAFTVTMSGLRTESSGWYYCVKGDFQMPVHVTVSEKPSTTTHATTRGFSTLTPTPDHISVTGDEPANGAETEQRSVSVESFVIPLTLLIFIVMVVLFIWFILKRYKKTKTESSATTVNGEEMTYCNVGNMRKASGQRSCAESDVDVMYSSVVTIKQQTAKRGEAKHNEVTYSTLAHHH